MACARRSFVPACKGGYNGLINRILTSFPLSKPSPIPNAQTNPTLSHLPIAHLPPNRFHPLP